MHLSYTELSLPFSLPLGKKTQKGWARELFEVKTQEEVTDSQAHRPPQQGREKWARGTCTPLERAVPTYASPVRIPVQQDWTHRQF